MWYLTDPTPPPVAGEVPPPPPPVTAPVPFERAPDTPYGKDPIVDRRPSSGTPQPGSRRLPRADTLARWMAGHNGPGHFVRIVELAGEHTPTYVCTDCGTWFGPDPSGILWGGKTSLEREVTSEMWLILHRLHDVDKFYERGRAEPVMMDCNDCHVAWYAAPQPPVPLVPDPKMIDRPSLAAGMRVQAERDRKRRNPPASYDRPGVTHWRWHKFLRRWFPNAFDRRVQKLLDAT